MATLSVVSSPQSPSDDDTSAQRKINDLRTPEVVIALCGPLGTPLHEVAETFKTLLTSSEYQNYTVRIIKLSGHIRKMADLQDDASVATLIDHGNSLRKSLGNAVLAQRAIKDISVAREELQPKPERQHPLPFDGNESVPAAVEPTVLTHTCHIIDSIKNVEELSLLRSVYGGMLHVIGVYSPIELRIDRLTRKLGASADLHKLINRDSGEEISNGQQVADTFHLADFFLRVNTGTDSQLTSRVRRFLDLMLGVRIITPTVSERAMYAAYSAARNSACLSRQVGAAITDEQGELLATGWNDVPRPFGGLYQNAGLNDSPDNDHRCWNKDGGKCFNDEEKTVIATQVIDKLIAAEVINQSDREKATELIRHDSQLRTLIEFSRAVHAEMHALLNASSTFGGRIVKGKLFVTTYPCHSCARHIVAAGISEIYFLEPYRKSLATKLHADALTESETDLNKVRIMPFDGVAPSRYLRFFSPPEAGRKNPKTGRMELHAPHPVTGISMEAVRTLEGLAIRELKSPPDQRPAQ